MADTQFRSIFGLAVTAANVRAVALGFSTKAIQGLCQSMAIGFGMSMQDGDTIFTHLQNNSGVFGETLGFGGGIERYVQYEANVDNILKAFLPSVTDRHRYILTAATHAIVFGYALNSEVDATALSRIVGKTLNETSQRVNNESVFSANKLGDIIHPFTPDVLKQLINESDYSKVVSRINQSPTSSDIPVVNYNWYDTSKIFAGPNLQVMKDVENQYYYVSGQLTYHNMIGQLEQCVEEQIVFNTWSGQATGTYIVNTPCSHRETYIGPITGVQFFRIFTDGPSSSGDFNGHVLTGYKNFDRSILTGLDYGSNYVTLYSFDRQGGTGDFLPLGSVFLDANGSVSLPFEYQNAPCGTGCGSSPLARMHIGDNHPRYICNYNGLGGCIGSSLQNVTGWKLVSMELSKDVWGGIYADMLTNPEQDVSRVLKRALNIGQNPYLATVVSGDYYPFWVDVNPPYTEHWYVGPPQLNGGNQLPSLAFWQTFDSLTFNERGTLALYPSISIAGGDNGPDSIRSASISQFPIFSGRSITDGAYNSPTPTVVPFNVTITSNMTGKDQPFKQFFGMGDSFAGQYTMNIYPCENAGFEYTGFTLSGSEGFVNPASLLPSYSGKVMGSPISKFNYIRGYKNQWGEIDLNQMYAQDASGNLIKYYYFDKRLNPSAAALPQNQWGQFAPLPEENNVFWSGWSRVYEEMPVENFIPRYYEGPFSYELRKFIYPQAANATGLYNPLSVGFPYSISFDIEIREETVREIFGTYEIYPNGVISDSPEIEPVVRASTGDAGTWTGTYMTNIFAPNTQFLGADYDFMRWNTDFFNVMAELSLVDNNYAPQYNSRTPSGKNSLFYDSPYSYATTLFANGVAMTGYGAVPIVMETGNGGVVTGYQQLPMNAGLYHAFRSVPSKNISIYYTPPFFDMTVGGFVMSEGLHSGFLMTSNRSDYLVDRFDGTTGYTQTGMDPIFYEFVNGRKGGNASGEGGYHSHGIIGDRWIGATSDGYKLVGESCAESVVRVRRDPSQDTDFLVFNSTPTGTTIFANGLMWAPFAYNSNPAPFQNWEDYKMQYRFDGQVVQPVTTFRSGFFVIDLAQIMPATDSSPNTLYDPTGAVFGPFDRDVVIGVFGGDSVYAYDEFLLNGSVFADRNAYSGAYAWCDYDSLRGSYWLNTGVVPGENNRDSKFTIINYVPKGKTCTINTFTTDGPSGGFARPSKIAIGARHMLWDEKYDANLFFGEREYLNPFAQVGNNSVPSYVINHPKFENLAGNHVFVNYVKTGKLYPVPGEDFTGMASLDAHGNLIYPPNATVETYWKRKARATNKSVLVSGVREGSRVSFKISNINILYDTIPYQSYSMVSPSGDCNISGQMGYYSQAEASVFTEGFRLNNTTPNDWMTGFYDPIYVSDVLRRVPWFVYPTGTLFTPVVSAPSIMKQRVNPSVITDDQKYYYLLNTAPYNYNKLNWPALSDLETLNAGETLEAVPPDDGTTFTTSTLLFSASQGQKLPNGNENPNLKKTYTVQDQYQLYDSLATDAILNSGKCITTMRGYLTRLSQDNLSGIIAPQGIGISMVGQGFK